MTFAFKPERTAHGVFIGGGRVEQRVRQARRVLFWERAQPTLVLAAAPIVLLLTLALLGAYLEAPAVLRWAATSVAIGCAAMFLWRGRRSLTWPKRRDALRRLELDTSLSHAPLMALDDAPFDSGSENPLWRIHQDESRRRVDNLKLRPPRATADRVDPYQARYAAAALFVLAFVVAGDDRGARLANLVTLDTPPATGGDLVDVWIEPPAYTGAASVHLIRGEEKLTGVKPQIDVPEGSKVFAQGPSGASLVFRTPKGETARQTAPGGDQSFWERLTRRPATQPVDENRARLEITLNENGVLSATLGGRTARWPVGVKRDAPPSIAWSGPVERAGETRLALPVLFLDDYGATSADLVMRLDPGQKRPLDAPALEASALKEARAVAVAGVAGRPGARKLAVDVAAEPWAGLDVLAKVVIVDGKGQRGETEEVRLSLPKRFFDNGSARAVLEQRQTLAVAPAAWPQTVRAFEAMTLAPERFYDRSKDFLLMRTAYWRLMRTKGEARDSTVDDFWTLALQLENAALADAKRALDAARQALKDALARGAGEPEIARLVDDLKRAMSAYLQSLAQKPSPHAGDGTATETLTAEDLEERLDALRKLAGSGARNAAEDALEELSQLLDNLRVSGGGQSGSGGQSGARGGAPEEAAALIGRQRELADKTAARGQSGGRTDDLAAAQRALEKEVEGLSAKAKAGGKAADALKRAGEAMRNAEKALGEGDTGDAGAAMEDAIERLREGAGALAKERSEATGAGAAGRDPLGRPIGPTSGEGVELPETIDAERARELREELRKRLSDGDRSEEEIRYLERLLERF